MTRYHEIADDLRRRILRSEYAVGDRLPGEQSLATDYGVSRGVIRNALASLQRRGLVASHPGHGWRVQRAFQTQEFTELRSFAQWAESRRLVPGGRVIHQQREPANATDARHLRMRAGDEVLRVARVRTLDERPMMIERSTYAPWVIPAIDALPADEASVTRAMLDAGVATASGTHRIDTVAASREDAEWIGVRRSTRLLRVQRTTFARDGRPIEHSDDRYAPDTITFTIHSTSSV